MASHHILSGCVLLVLMLTLTQAKDFHVPVISDVHLELNYDPRVTSYDYCLRGGRPATEPAFYGRRGCDTPHTLFYSALQRMKNVESHPDLIIVPGDMVTHFLCFEDNREFNETIYQEILSVMNNYTQTTAAVFPGVPVVFTEGNADYMYDYQVPTPKYKTRHYQALYDSWIKNIPANSAADNKDNHESMMESGSYVQEITKELVVVSFNSVYFSIRNNASNDPGIAEKILKWVERQLLQARQKKQKVILVYHIPHGTYITPVKEECFWVHEYQNEIFRIEREYSETISAIFTGHIHSSYLQSVEQARLLRPSARQQTQAAPEYFGNLVVMRAVAPIFQNNPGFAIFTYENSNFSYFSYYDDYTFLLSRAINTIEDPQHFWTQLYNSRRDLGLENLSAAGIAQFIRTLPFDPQKLIKYMFYKIGEPFKPAYSRSELAVQVCGAAELNPIRTSICANELLGELNRTVPGQR